MAVSSITTGPVAAGRYSSRKSAPHGFTVATDAPEEADIERLGTVGSLAALVDAQESHGRGRRQPSEDREVLHHAWDILAELDDLHRELLGSGRAGDPLGRLARLVAAPPRPSTNLPLAEAMAEIHLRARVELARQVVSR